jgi:hypothetical protein
MYTYEALLEGEIRILVLQPGEYTDKLRIQLKKVRLEDKPTYNAISYAWQGQKPNIPIECAGQEFRITPNLRDALVQFRHQNEPQQLWADAICINQTDDDEKTRQVQLMSSIYAQTVTCLVWLGRRTSSDALAFQAIEHLYSNLVRIWPECGLPHLEMLKAWVQAGHHQYYMSEDEFNRFLADLPDPEACLDALESLLSRSW